MKRFTRLRLLNFILAFALIGTIFLHLTLAATAGFYGSIEQDQINRVNARRASIGRSSLQHIECLNAIAEIHAKEMADSGGIYHTSYTDFTNRVQYACGGDWSILGENVGVGYSSAGLFDAFMSSTGHRANIEDSHYAKAGMGAYVRADGTVWITQLFANCSNCTPPWSTNATVAVDPVTATSQGWSNWENLSGVLQTGTSPAAASWSSSRLDVFVQGTTNDLYQKFWEGKGWQGYHNLGGRDVMAPNSSPAAVSWGPNRIDVFARSKSNTLIHKWWNGGWSGWEDLGGNITSAPAVASWTSGRLDVFARGGDGSLHHKFYSNKWSGWESLGGAIIGAPTAVSWDVGRIDVFARGTDNAVYQKAWTGTSWSKWTNQGGIINEAPGVSSWAKGRLDVFVRGTSNSIYQKYFSGSWSGWKRLDSQQLTSGIAAVSWGPNRIDVFARGPKGELLHKWYPN